MSYALRDLAAHVGAELHPSAAPELAVEGVCGVSDDLPDRLSFVDDERLKTQAETSRIPAFITRAGKLVEGKSNLLHPEPEYAIALIAALFRPEFFAQPEPIHPSAVVDPDTTLAEGVSIGPNCVVGRGVKIGARSRLLPGAVVQDRTTIGEDCLLHANTVVREDCVLGNRVIIQPGAIIGGDGYGYVVHGGEHVKIPQLGNVILEDDVEVGANATIDRGRFSATRIGRGTKVDNLVMLGHNVQTGERCLLVSQTGICGSTRLGDDVIMAGQVGVNGHIEVASGVTVLGQSMVTKDIRESGVWAGQPVRPVRIWRRAVARFYRGLRDD